jgi:hypothetical protein
MKSPITHHHQYSYKSADLGSDMNPRNEKNESELGLRVVACSLGLALSLTELAHIGAERREYREWLQGSYWAKSAPSEQVDRWLQEYDLAHGWDAGTAGGCFAGFVIMSLAALYEWGKEDEPRRKS